MRLAKAARQPRTFPYAVDVYYKTSAGSFCERVVLVAETSGQALALATEQVRSTKGVMAIEGIRWKSNGVKV